jgi:redox-sensitive bicupin YhaK (pirin superfamily)
MDGHCARRLIDGDDAAFSDPFLIMAEDWMPRGSFALHPHRGIETVTFVIEGLLEHFDNAGHSGTIRADDAQWMTAGRGVLHEENPPLGAIAHTLQLWINLPAAQKMTEPRYQDLVAGAMPVRREAGVELRVFSGRSADVTSATLNHVPVTMLDVRIEPEARCNHDLPATDNAFVYVLEGQLKVGGAQKPVKSGQLAWLTRSDDQGPSELALTAEDAAARVLVFAGRPLREPVAFGGPVRHEHAGRDSTGIRGLSRRPILNLTAPLPERGGDFWKSMIGRPTWIGDSHVCKKIHEAGTGDGTFDHPDRRQTPKLKSFISAAVSGLG